MKIFLQTTIEKYLFNSPMQRLESGLSFVGDYFTVTLKPFRIMYPSVGKVGLDEGCNLFK